MISLVNANPINHYNLSFVNSTDDVEYNIDDWKT